MSSEDINFVIQLEALIGNWGQIYLDEMASTIKDKMIHFGQQFADFFRDEDGNYPSERIEKSLTMGEPCLAIKVRLFEINYFLNYDMD